MLQGYLAAISTASASESSEAFSFVYRQNSVKMSLIFPGWAGIITVIQSWRRGGHIYRNK